MTELEILRAANRALRERCETTDIALGGFLNCAEGSIEIMRSLGERFEHDAVLFAAITADIGKWSDLITEVISRMRAFHPVPGAPVAN